MRFFERMECVTFLMSDFINALMDVNLLLGTEQALMLHSISTNNMSIPKLQPHSQYWWYIHVPHCSYVMKRKPCLHDGI